MILLPSADMTPETDSSQSSSLIDLTLETCTPNPRCIPEHSMHSVTPRLMLAHVGPVEEIHTVESAEGREKGIQWIYKNIQDYTE